MKNRKCRCGIRRRNGRLGRFPQLHLAKKRGRIDFQCCSQHLKSFGIGVLGLSIGMLDLSIGMLEIGTRVLLIGISLLDLSIGMLEIGTGVLLIGILVLIARALETLLSAFGKLHSRRLDCRFVNTHVTMLANGGPGTYAKRPRRTMVATSGGCEMFRRKSLVKFYENNWISSQSIHLVESQGSHLKTLVPFTPRPTGGTLASARVVAEHFSQFGGEMRHCDCRR
jgi:hypothetical protein